MAESSTSGTPKRKPATKRTTTRARKTPAKSTTAAQPKTEVSPAEKQAKLESYQTLSNAGLYIPEELRKEVEPWINEARKEAEAVDAERKQAEEAGQEKYNEMIREANESGPKYVRNLLHTPFALRLDRQTERRRIELKPRGVPGDMHPLEDADLNDPILRQNVGLNVIEIIPAGIAAQVMSNQTHNMGTRVHSPLATLRNAEGKEYQEGSFKVEQSYEDQGIVAARIEGDLYNKQHVTNQDLIGGKSELGGGLARPHEAKAEVSSGFVPTGGNPAIVSDGSQQFDAHSLDPKIQADISRRTGREADMRAGVGDLKVTVNPVQKA